MIEPYETALRDSSPGFSKLGFSLARNTDYGATFSNGTFSIELSTDRYYQPGLSGAICDPTGKKFEIGLIQQILDPMQYSVDMAKLKEIQMRFGLDRPDTPTEARLQGVREYVRVTLDRILTFFAAYKEKVFASPNEYEADYALRSNALMSKIVKDNENKMNNLS